MDRVDYSITILLRPCAGKSQQGCVRSSEHGYCVRLWRAFRLSYLRSPTL